MQATCKVAAAAATEASADPVLTGIDPVTIITLISTLLPVLSQLFSSCFGPKPTPTSVKAHLNDVYDGTSYDRGTLRVATRKARVNARQHGQKIDDSQAQAVAVHTLDQLRTADDADVQEALDVSSG